MSEHTATPWVFNYSTSKRLAFVETAERDIGKFRRIVEISKSNNKNFDADAAFIVRACNAHDDLLAACKAINEWLGTDDAARALPTEPPWYNQLRAAIAAAEEGHEAKNLNNSRAVQPSRGAQDGDGNG